MSATMMNRSPRQVLTPGPSTKRKERDNFNGVKPLVVTTKSLAKPSVHRAASPLPVKTTQPACNNHLLAGYLAHEFLTKGTLLGEAWDPARAEAVPSSSRAKPEKRKAESSGTTEKQLEKQLRYVEVADLLKGGGAHLPGIINPKQLARFLHM